MINEYPNSQFIVWTHEGVAKETTVLLGETAKIEYTKDREVQNDAGQKELHKRVEPRKPVQRRKPKKGGCSTCGAKGIKNLLLGGAKLLKAELGMDASDEETMESRKSICQSCEHYDFGVCGECGCFCAAKVKLKSESCKIGKW